MAETPRPRSKTPMTLEQALQNRETARQLLEIEARTADWHSQKKTVALAALAGVAYDCPALTALARVQNQGLDCGEAGYRLCCEVNTRGAHPYAQTLGNMGQDPRLAAPPKADLAVLVKSPVRAVREIGLGAMGRVVLAS